MPSGSRLAGPRLVHQRRHRADQRADAVAGHRGDDEPGLAVGREPELDRGRWSPDVGLRADDEPGPVEQIGRYSPSSWSSTASCSAGAACRRARRGRRARTARGRARRGGGTGGRARALAGALDQAGDVGDHELGVVVDAHDAEVRLERRERVVGDLRLGGRDDADQRALADVGEPDERDVGDQLQLELEPALLAVLALLGEARRAPPVGQEPGVAAAAPAAAAAR